MNPKVKNIVTSVLVGVLAAAPQVMPFVPTDYRDLATAVIAVAGSVYHLFQPVPGAKS
jgi:hypothetical protein